MFFGLIFGIGLVIALGLSVFSPKTMRQMKVTHGLIGVITPWLTFIWLTLTAICFVMAFGDSVDNDVLVGLCYASLVLAVMVLLFGILLATGAGMRHKKLF